MPGIREDDETFKSPWTCCLTVGEADANHFAVRQYKKYKLAAEMYALSDFLIMVFVMVSEAVT